MAASVGERPGPSLSACWEVAPTPSPSAFGGCAQVRPRHGLEGAAMATIATAERASEEMAVESRQLFPRDCRRSANWERPALVALLVATALRYLSGLGAPGWANAYISPDVPAQTDRGQ